MAIRGTKGKYSRALIPKEYKSLWNKDHDDLEETQRVEMVQIYLDNTQKYEFGQLDKKIPVPKFMKQRDKVRAFENKKRSEALELRLKEEEKRLVLEAEKKAEEDELAAEKRRKEEKAQAIVDKWNSDAVISLNLQERLRLENIQLRKDLISTQISALKTQLEILDYKLDTVAEECAKKYEIILEEYDLDLKDGRFLRKPHVEFPQDFLIID